MFVPQNYSVHICFFTANIRSFLKQNGTIRYNNCPRRQCFSHFDTPTLQNRTLNTDKQYEKGHKKRLCLQIEDIASNIYINQVLQDLRESDRQYAKNLEKFWINWLILLDCLSEWDIDNLIITNTNQDVALTLKQCLYSSISSTRS